MVKIINEIYPLVKKGLLCLLPLLILSYSCGKEEASQGVNAELSSYIKEFENEAKKRGADIDLENLEALIVDTIEFSRPVCGLGATFEFMDRGFPQILIDRNCWDSYNSSTKEILVFHELGHAILGRNHINSYLPDGYIPKSIMNTTLGFGFESSKMRDYYIDELFDIKTPFPFENGDSKTILLNEEFENDLDGWELYSYNTQTEDYDLVLDWESFQGVEFTKENGSKSISLSIDESFPNDIILLKRFDIENFRDCANLLATADIKTEDLDEGYFSFGISLRERKENGELERFSFLPRLQTEFFSSNYSFNDFVAANYCIPLKTDVVSVSFVFSSENQSKLIIENVKVELFE